MALNKINKLSSQVSTIAGKIPVLKSTPNLDSRVEVITNLSILDNAPPVVTQTSDEFFTSKLLNYVEPVLVSGVTKTAFYSELSTNINAGDKVQILNGFYDSDDYIQKDKYAKFTDGYRVLAVDGCKIILNIDYTGQLPYTDFNQEDLIFVHSVTSDEYFKWINSSWVGLSFSQSVNTQNNKTLYPSFSGQIDIRQVLNLYGNNIAFVPAGKTFTFFTNDRLLIGNSSNPVITISGGANGRFFIRNSGGVDWIDVTNIFLANNLRILNKKINPRSKTGNKKIIVLGEDFTYLGFTFKERCVYKYSTEKSSWIFDKSYEQPLISKLNFRGGTFKGKHQDGIFGSYDKVVNWNSATWNSGFFINSLWISGDMNSKSKRGARNFIARVLTDSNGNRTVSQNTDVLDNGGFGYNYTIDSTIQRAIIRNGNFENSNIGVPNVVTSIDNYYSKGTTHSVTVSGGSFNFCDIQSTLASKSTIADSILTNSVLKQSRSVNNQLVDSVGDNLDYSSDGGLKIIDADVYSYYFQQNQNVINRFSDVRGVLKLFISDADYLRLDRSDSFYLEKINKQYFLSSLSTDEKILMPIERRFFLDYGIDREYEDSGFTVTVTLKSKNENQYKYYTKLITVPSYTDYYEPTYLNTTYWEPALPTGFSNPVIWNASRQPYSQGASVLYVDQGIEKLYYYNGDELDNPGELDNPTEDSDYWTEVGPVPVGEWDYIDSLDYEVVAGDVWMYFVGGVEYWIKRTTTPGDGYVQLIRVQTGTKNERTIIVTDPRVNACSIDIDTRNFGYYENTVGNKIYTNDGLEPIPIDSWSKIFTDNYIKLADFRSGLFVNSIWRSGYNQNYFPNIIAKNTPTSLMIFYSQPNRLRVRTFQRALDASAYKRGLDLKKNDIVWLNGVYHLFNGVYTNVSGRYRLSQDSITTAIAGIPYYEYFIISLDVSFANLSSSGVFVLKDAEDSNYLSLTKFQMENSTIISGFFKRTNFKSVSITNPDFNNQDADFTLDNIYRLRFINTIFTNNNARIDDGVFFKSHIADPVFNSGIVHNSIWNGATFSSGIFNSGYWKSGTFVTGRFLNSKEISLSTVDYSSVQQYGNWTSGKFNSGEFYNSVWLDGIFNNGTFWNSDFYGGVWNNGILGSVKIPYSNTTFGHYARLSNIGGTCSIWNNGTVENALMGGDGVVYWFNGRYLSGELTSFGQTPTKETIWFNGDFTGSKITGLTRWKNGRFNSGKFWSIYGWDKVNAVNPSTNPSDYSWENGLFIKGEFGNKGLTANSTWYNGRFLDGTFWGRFWKDGYFFGGEFQGTGDLGLTPSSISSVGEFNFADSFRENYYGLWHDGQVLDNVFQSSSGNKSLTSQNYNTQTLAIKNALWVNGTFSHRLGTFNNGLFLGGSFYNGNFDGVFNPYIDRTFTGNTQSLSFGSNAKWFSGNFITGSFWSSEWRKGNFYNGYMSGAKWNDGTWYYGTAENILWLDGTWKNGNWNGSPYDWNLISATESFVDYNSTGDLATVSRLIMNEGREKDVIYKTSQFNDNNPFVHLLNVFSASIPTVLTADGFTNSRSWTASSPNTYSGAVLIQPNPRVPPRFETRQLNRSEWAIFGGFQIVRRTTTANYLVNGQVFQTVKPLKTSTGLANVNDANLSTYGGNLPVISSQTLYGYNIFSDEGSSFRAAPSKRLFSFRGGTTSLFTSTSTRYTVTLTVAVELAETVTIDIYTGALSYSTYQLASDAYKYTEGIGRGDFQYEDYYAKVYTITTVYNTTVESLSTRQGRELYIEKTSEGILRLLRADITYQTIDYNLEFNNTLFQSLLPSLNSVDFPTYSVSLSALSGNGKEVGLNFGNGVFRRGIWENGVWNNGFRSGSGTNGWNQNIANYDDLIKGSSISRQETYQIDLKTWIVTINVFSKNLNVLTRSKKASLGNVVGIDTNGKRTFFREPVDIVEIREDLGKIKVKIVTNFTLRQVIQDSSEHPIYLTQNIWLNGVFLNGFFRGVWSNGLFKGNPRLTEANDIAWVDGVFDGGHFISQFVPTDIRGYNSSVIQNMTFYDNNVGDVGKLSYRSWIETNYSTQSFVNLNSDIYQAYLDTDLLTTDKLTFAFNLRGYPLFDVLSSVSYFRDKNSSVIRKYNLGTKSTKKANLILNDGDFKDSVSTITYKDPNGVKMKSIGVKSFLNAGWTYSYYDVSGDRQLILESNSNINDAKKLRISITASSILNTALYLTLQNTRLSSNQLNRYYQMQVVFSNFEYAPDKSVGPGQFAKSSYIYFTPPFLVDPNNSSGFSTNAFDHALTTTNTKIEYFYNKINLDLQIKQDSRSTKIVKTDIDNISFNEVDMIPFFLYATESTVDLSVIPPYVAVAPIIDYTNQDFNFVDNIDLGIDFKVVNSQNSVVLNKSIAGTSIPIQQYQGSNTAEEAELTFDNGGGGLPSGSDEITDGGGDTGGQ